MTAVRRMRRGRFVTIGVNEVGCVIMIAVRCYDGILRMMRVTGCCWLSTQVEDLTSPTLDSVQKLNTKNLVYDIIGFYSRSAIHFMLAGLCVIFFHIT